MVQMPQLQKAFPATLMFEKIPTAAGLLVLPLNTREIRTYAWSVDGHDSDIYSAVRLHYLPFNYSKLFSVV